MTENEIEIELQGADSAHHARMSEKQSRLFDFPDGVRRLITLPYRYWLAYDSIDNAWGIRGGI